jgi:hypothetical protein
MKAQIPSFSIECWSAHGHVLSLMMVLQAHLAHSNYSVNRAYTWNNKGKPVLMHPSEWAIIRGLTQHCCITTAATHTPAVAAAVPVVLSFMCLCCCCMTRNMHACSDICWLEASIYPSILYVTRHQTVPPAGGLPEPQPGQPAWHAYMLSTLRPSSAQLLQAAGSSAAAARQLSCLQPFLWPVFQCST